MKRAFLRAISKRFTPFGIMLQTVVVVLFLVPLLLRAQDLAIGDASIGIIDGVSGGGGFSARGEVSVLDPEASVVGGYSAAGRVTLVVPETPSSPSLNITRTGNQVVISWPVAAGDFALDETSSLTGTINWSPVSPPYVTNATQINITVPVSTGPRFYRLRKP